MIKKRHLSTEVMPMQWISATVETRSKEVPFIEFTFSEEFIVRQVPADEVRKGDFKRRDGNGYGRFDEAQVRRLKAKARELAAPFGVVDVVLEDFCTYMIDANGEMIAANKVTDVFDKDGFTVIYLNGFTYGSEYL
jgi:hypothetical protein